MDDTARPSPEPALDAGKWIGRVLIAVILGEGIWGLIVSVTNNLILPFMARIMGTDARSPLSLGNGQFNVPGLFISVLELCFAGIVAVILNSLIQRKPKTTSSKPVKVGPIPVKPAAPSPSPPRVVPVPAAAPAPPPVTVPIPVSVAASPAPSPPAASSASPKEFWSPPESSKPQAAPVPVPPVPKPAKPKPPREILYNSVGEPLPFDDDE
jgi:hypothetical protein